VLTCITQSFSLKLSCGYHAKSFQLHANTNQASLQDLHPAEIFKLLKGEGSLVSFASVTRIIKKLRLTSSMSNLTRFGRPTKLSVEASTFTDQQMRSNDEMTSAQIQKRLAKCGVAVSSSTVRRSRKQQGWTL